MLKDQKIQQKATKRNFLDYDGPFLFKQQFIEEKQQKLEQKKKQQSMPYYHQLTKKKQMQKENQNLKEEQFYLQQNKQLGFQRSFNYDDFFGTKEEKQLRKQQRQVGFTESKSEDDINEEDMKKLSKVKLSNLIFKPVNMLPCATKSKIEQLSQSANIELPNEGNSNPKSEAKASPPPIVEIEKEGRKKKKKKNESQHFQRYNLKQKYSEHYRGATANYISRYKQNGKKKTLDNTEVPLYKQNTRKFKIQMAKQQEKLRWLDEQYYDSSKPENVISGIFTQERELFLRCQSNALKLSFNLYDEEEIGRKKLSTNLEQLEALDWRKKEDLEFILREYFGFCQFRDGQLQAIQNIMDGKSTFVQLSTGQGKSLIYQFPCLLKKGLTVVISPIISLMLDQLDRLPPSIPGVCYNSFLNIGQKLRILELIKSNKVKLLYISPESLEQNSELTKHLCEFPRVHLLCLDEAHCASEISHSFRPSYLKLDKQLSRTIKPEVVLALTATATKATEKSIIGRLNLSENVSSGSRFRNEIKMVFVKSDSVYFSVLQLVRKLAPKNRAGIIYCQYVYEVQKIHSYLSQSDLGSGVSLAQYHGQMTPNQRLSIQEDFMSGKLNVIIATSAFGMGIDKQNIRFIICVNFMKSLEELIQAVGRVARDGVKGGIGVVVAESNEFRRFRGLVWQQSVGFKEMQIVLQKIWEEHQFQLLEKEILDPNQNQTQQGSQSQLENLKSFVKKRKKQLKKAGINSGHLLTFEDQAQQNTDNAQSNKLYCLSVKSLEKQTNLRKGWLVTLFLKLEEKHPDWIEVYPLMSPVCTIKFYKTAAKVLAQEYPLIQKIYEYAIEHNGSFTINIIRLCNLLEAEPHEIMNQLVDFARLGLMNYELSNESICYRLKKHEIDEHEQDAIVQFLFDCIKEQERIEIFKLDLVYLLYQKLMYPSVDYLLKNNILHLNDTTHIGRQEFFQNFLTRYFAYEGHSTPDLIEDEVLPFFDLDEKVKGQIEQEIERFLNEQILSTRFAQLSKELAQQLLNPKNITRLLLGITSQQFVYQEWKNSAIWQKYLDYKFEDVLAVASDAVAAFFAENDETLKRIKLIP